MSKKPVRYYNTAVDSETREGFVTIFGDITSWPWFEGDVSSYRLATVIQQMDVDAIHVHINSYGGEVGEALAIMNTLLQHPAEVISYVDGFACSAASIILMAGTRRIAGKCSNILVHPAHTFADGTAADLRKTADDLDTITEQSVTAYLSRISKSREELLDLMAQDRFMTPQEALDWGFVTEVQDLFDNTKPTQSVRELVSQRLTAPAPQTPPPAEKTVSTFLSALARKEN